MIGRIRSLLISWQRIIELSRRPDYEEYMLLLKLVAIGFALVGFLGYTIHMIYVLLTTG